MKNNVIKDPSHQPSEVFSINPPIVRAGRSLASSLFSGYKASPYGAAVEMQFCRSFNLIEMLEFPHMIIFDLQMHVIFLKITDIGKQAFSQKQHS